MILAMQMMPLEEGTVIVLTDIVFVLNHLAEMALEWVAVPDSLDANLRVDVFIEFW